MTHVQPSTSTSFDKLLKEPKTLTSLILPLYLHRLMTRAYELRDRREVERREQVKKAYETVWKDSCDDLRELDCRALDQFMGHEREKQIVEKKERKALEEINANAYYAEWTKRLDAIANADKAKQDARAEANARTAQGLQAQIANKEATQEMMYSRMMAEAAQENQECDDAITADKQAQWQKKMDAVSRGQSVMAFNEKYKEQSAEKAQIESEHDSILLQNALKLEKAQIDFENNKKREGAEAAKKYRKYLEEMMVKEAEDTGFVDEMNKREADKVQQARDDALQARQDARDYLMKLVHEGRAEQILYKEAQGRKEKEEGKLFANRFLDDMKAGIVKDKADVDARRAKNIMNQEKLMAQMSERERAAAAVKQEVFLEDKRMQLIEKKHREKLSMQGGVVRIAFPKKRPDTR